MKTLKIKALNEDGSTCLVKDVETGKVYVEKIVSVRQRKVYEQLRTLELHNVPHIYEIEELEDGYLKIYEEHIEGENLQQLLDKGVIFSEQQTKTILLNLCNILEKVHANKIVHRDIKPSNIIINEAFDCFVIDFGIARTPDSEKTTDTRLLGTKGFAAPEQFGFGQSDEKTDIYALGVTANYILSGETDINKLYKGQITPIISKCIELKPASRYKSVTELKRALLKKYRWKYLAIMAAGIATIVFVTFLIVNHQSNNKKSIQQTIELGDLVEKTISTKEEMHKEPATETTTEALNIEPTLMPVEPTKEITIKPTKEITIKPTAEIIVETTVGVTTEPQCQHVNKIVQSTEWEEINGKHVKTETYRCDDCWKKLETVELSHNPEMMYDWDSMMSDFRENGFWITSIKKYPEMCYGNSNCEEPVVLSCSCKRCTLNLEIKPQSARCRHDYGGSTPNYFSTIVVSYALPKLKEDGYLVYVCEYCLCNVKKVTLERGYHILMPDSNVCPECGVELTEDNKNKFKEYDLNVINKILELQQKYNGKQRIPVF